MMGIWTRSALRRLATSKPSMSGSMTSSTSRSGLNDATASSAERPSPTDSTVKPWKRRAMEMTSAMFGSSSTTRTRGASGVAVVITLSSVGALAVSFLGACPEAAARTLGMSEEATPAGQVLVVGPRRRLQGDEVVEVVLQRAQDLVALGVGELAVLDARVELLGDRVGDRRLEVVQGLALLLGDLGDRLAVLQALEQVVALDPQRLGGRVERAAGAGVEAQDR